MLEPGDHVKLVLKPDTRPLVDRIFAEEPPHQVELPAGFEFPLRAGITVAEFEEMYGIVLGVSRELTLGEALHVVSVAPPKVGQVIRCREATLRVRQMDASGAIEQVGLIVDEG